MNKVYVVCRCGSPEDHEREDHEQGWEPRPGAKIWTISPDPKERGWENDCDTEGYGLDLKTALFYAKCINEALARGERP